jgi:NAD(P)H dehydrogenase (quinone)
MIFDNTSRENELREKNWDMNLQKAYEKGCSFFDQGENPEA